MQVYVVEHYTHFDGQTFFRYKNIGTRMPVSSRIETMGTTMATRMRQLKPSVESAGQVPVLKGSMIILVRGANFKSRTSEHSCRFS